MNIRWSHLKKFAALFNIGQYALESQNEIGEKYQKRQNFFCLKIYLITSLRLPVYRSRNLVNVFLVRERLIFSVCPMQSLKILLCILNAN